MEFNLELISTYVCFYPKIKIPIKGNVSVDVYMYYHARGLFTEASFLLLVKELKHDK